MPTGYGIGDHLMFVMDIAARSLLGNKPTQIVQPQARGLHCRIPGVKEKYTKCLEELIDRHWLIEKVGRAYNAQEITESERLLNKIDDECTQYMKHAEKTCRKFHTGRIPFSPMDALWIRRCQVYRSLLKYHLGKIKNKGNL